MKRTSTDLVRGWLEKARRDLAAARMGLHAPEPLTDIACFHAQQAAEEYLKAFLILHAVDFPRSHVLETLVLLAAEKDAGFVALEADAASLTPFAVEARYPEFEEPRLADARAALRSAERIALFVLSRVPDHGGRPN